MTPIEAKLPDGLTIRPFSSLAEYEACADFQEEIWGLGFSEKVPPAILMIANRLSGLAAGAFAPDGTIQGFVFGLTGVIDGRLVHWSDMLGVRADRRDGGLGTQLKGYQRAVLLERGIQEMRWTFDPLQGRNAHVNFTKLGIVSREYVENMYGDTESPLHRIGTDRLIATWEMDSSRVLERLRRAAPLDGGSPGSTGSLAPTPVPRGREAGESDLTVGANQEAEVVPVLGLEPGSPSGQHPRPGAPVLGRDATTVSLAVPESIDDIMAVDMELAVAWRHATREAFVHYMSRGYEVREFLRGAGSSTYLLSDPRDDGTT